jgi:hypothetical protein
MNRPVRAAAEDKRPKEQNVGESEEGECDPEVQQELIVDRVAVQGRVRGEMPEAESRRDRLRGGHEVIVVCWR